MTGFAGPGRDRAGSGAKARVAAALALTLALALGGCDQAPARRGDAPREPVAVAMVLPGTLALPETVAVSGELAAQEELVLGFQVAGRLQQLDVDVGDAVAAGTVVAALDAQDFRLGLDRASAALASARVRLGLPAEDEHAELAIDATAPVREAQAVLAEAQQSRARLQELVRQSLRAQADLDVAEAGVQVAESRLQAARDAVRTWLAEYGERRIDLALAQKRAQDARLVAPWPGRVAARHVAPGRFVQPGEAIVTLLRIDPLRLRLHVPERLAARVAIDQQVAFTVDGTGPSEHTGIVARLGAAIDGNDRTLLVEAKVDNGGGALLPGGFCRARIVVAPAQAVLAVPIGAVQSFAGIDRVFTVEDGKAVEVQVELGRRQDGLVEIRSGLAAGQRIVAEPRGLVQGTPVAAKD